MKPSDYFSLFIALVCLVLAGREFWYFKKGYGLKFRSFANPNFAGEKPDASKGERINLLVQGIVFVLIALVFIYFSQLHINLMGAY